MMRVTLLLFLTGVAARGNDLLNRFTTIPLDFLSFLFGTKESLLGGLSLPLDSRLLALVSANSDYYFHERSEPAPLRDTNWCRSFYATRARWQHRYDQLLSADEGSTVEGSPWTALIDAPEELEKMSEQQMECLLGLGYAPPRIPLGQVYGRVLSVLGNALIRDLSEAVWGGKLIVKTTCDDGLELFISCNQVGYGTGAFAHLSLGTGFNDEVIPAAYPPERIDDDAYLYINYGRNFTAACEPRIPRHYMSTTALPIRPAWRSWLSPLLIPLRLTGAPGVGLTAPARLTAGIFDNPWPVNHIVDLCRWIGRDNQEELDIYLCKSTMLFPEGLRPVLWFNLKAGDLMEVELEEQA